MTQARKRAVVRLASGLGGLFLVAISIYYLRSFLAADVAPAKKVVQEVRIIRPPPPELKPPPPPPPPPPEEEVDLPNPAPEEPVPSDQPPPGEQLGVDAAGTGAGDGFGLVGRPGGRDLLAPRGSSYSAYAGLVKDEILEHLGTDTHVRSGSYSVVVRLWVRSDGTVEKANLIGSSGDRERDRLIERMLSQLARVSKAPPADMPQPISLRIVSRA